MPVLLGVAHVFRADGWPKLSPDRARLHVRNMHAMHLAGNDSRCWVYRLVETAVHSLMTEEGRAHAAKIIREATADM